MLQRCAIAGEVSAAMKARACAGSLLLIGIALLEIPFVGRGYLVYILERDGTPLSFILIEDVGVGIFRDHSNKVFGESEGIVNTSVHPHSTQRIVQVRGVAGQKRASDTIAACHSLMHRQLSQLWLRHRHPHRLVASCHGCHVPRRRLTSASATTAASSTKPITASV